jgi:hypothetical protein
VLVCSKNPVADDGHDTTTVSNTVGVVGGSASVMDSIGESDGEGGVFVTTGLNVTELVPAIPSMV